MPEAAARRPSATTRSMGSARSTKSAKFSTLGLRTWAATLAFTSLMQGCKRLPARQMPRAVSGLHSGAETAPIG